MRKSLLLLCCAAAVIVAPALAQNRGLAPAPDALGGPVWQARFERDASPLLPASGLNAWLLSTAPAQSLRLMGDYQFSALRLGHTGGLRLTGGVLINLRPSSAGPGSIEGAGALPYAGVGYASSGLRGAWDFSADLGMAAPGLGSARPDRSAQVGNGLGLDNAPRLLPMIRLGMNLAF